MSSTSSRASSSRVSYYANGRRVSAPLSPTSTGDAGSMNHPRRHAGHRGRGARHLSGSLDRSRGTRPRSTRDGRRHSLANFHFAVLGIQLLDGGPAAFAAVELLVTGRRGAVLPGLPDALLAGGCPPTSVVVIASPTHGGLGCRHRSLLCLVDGPDRVEPPGGCYSPVDPSLGLALGALVAVAAPWLMQVPQRLAAWATWLAPRRHRRQRLLVRRADALSRGHGPRCPSWARHWSLPGAHPFPLGHRTAAWSPSVPVVGDPLILPLPVALADPHPGRRIGREASLPFAQNLLWVGVALGASVLTYRFIENPIRHARVIAQNVFGSIGLGGVLIGVTLIVATVTIDTHGTTATAGVSAIPILSAQQVHGLVAESSSIQSVPPNISPTLSSAFFDFGQPTHWTGCGVGPAQISEPSCTFGAPDGRHTMVIYGDSHARMWATALNDIAVADKWKLVSFFKEGCPALRSAGLQPARLRSPRGTIFRVRPVASLRHRSDRRASPSLVVVTDF